jgi:hypothetical protein
MSEATSQEVEVTVEATITRLLPCPAHAGSVPRCMVLDDGMRVPVGGSIPAGRRVAQNPNGYHHDCPDCASTPTKQETLERTVTRHVL